VLIDTNEMLSTPNFHTPALALALDTLAIAHVHLATASAQRIVKLMAPHLSGLPKYLSPVGGASAGFMPMQKTVAALLGEIRLHGQPASLGRAAKVLHNAIRVAIPPLHEDRASGPDVATARDAINSSDVLSVLADIGLKSHQHA
jgi:histidine ammonia-lyase